MLKLDDLEFCRCVTGDSMDLLVYGEVTGLLELIQSKDLSLFHLVCLDSSSDSVCARFVVHDSLLYARYEKKYTP